MKYDEADLLESQGNVEGDEETACEVLASAQTDENDPASGESGESQGNVYCRSVNAVGSDELYHESQGNVGCHAWSRKSADVAGESQRHDHGEKSCVCWRLVKVYESQGNV